MADNYTVTGQNRTVLVRSPTQVEDVEEISAVTKPSGVSFVRAIPYATWHAKHTGPLIEPIATHVEQIMLDYPVASGSATQNVDRSGLLSNAVEFVVSIPSPDPQNPGTMQATVTVPVQALHDLDNFDSYFQPILDALRATANL